MGKINIGFFYGKLFNSRNRTFSLENGENFIEGTGQVCQNLDFHTYILDVLHILTLSLYHVRHKKERKVICTTYVCLCSLKYDKHD